MSKNTTTASSAEDDDFFSLILILVIGVLMGYFLINLLSYPLTFLVGLYASPAFYLGIWGILIVSFIYALILGIRANSHAKNFKGKVYENEYSKLPYFNRFIKGILKQPLVLLLFVCYLVFPFFDSFYLPITNVCKGDKGFWIFNCPNIKTFIFMPKSSLFMLFILPLFPFLLYSFYIALICFKTALSNPYDKYKSPLSVEQYISLQKSLYPHLHFYEKVNPLKLPLFTGKGRLLDGVRQFVLSNLLIDEFVERSKKTKDTTTNATNDEIAKESLKIEPQNQVPILNDFAFEQQMLLQLGSVWLSVDNLNDLELILFSTVVPRLKALDPDLSDKEAKATLSTMYKMIDENWIEVTKSVNENGEVIAPFNAFFLQKRKDILNESVNHYIFKAITESHAYVRTILFAIFIELRKLGVIQSCEFSWVVYFDRSLWATINNIGRPSYFCEGLGSASHYLSELYSGEKLYTPEFKGAKLGIEALLSSYNFPPELVEAYLAWQKDGDIEPLSKSKFFNRKLGETDELGVPLELLLTPRKM